VVVDDVLWVTATLHHGACQEPRWTRSGLVVPQWRATTAARLVRVPFGDAGRVPFTPTLIANPSLEQVMLARTPGGYRATTVDDYRPLGLTTPGGAIPSGRPDTVESWLTAEAVIVRCGQMYWTVPVRAQDGFAQEIRSLGEVVLGVSTALDPAVLVNPEPVKRVLRAGDIALVRAPLSREPAPELTGHSVMLEAEFADADEARNAGRLAETPWPGPTYDPGTGRFAIGAGMDGPAYWTLHLPGVGVCNGLVAGPPKMGKSNALRLVVLEALASGVFRYGLADPLDRNGLVDVLGQAADHTARTRQETISLLADYATAVTARAPLAQRSGDHCFRDPSRQYPALLLVIDDAQEVLRDPKAAALAARIAVHGPAVGVGLVVASTSVELADFGGSHTLLSAVSDTNCVVFDHAQFERLQRVRSNQ
jgi:hypothetical protein